MHATALQELSRRPALSRIEFVEMCARKLDEWRNGMSPCMSHAELERLLGLIHDTQCDVSSVGRRSVFKTLFPRPELAAGELFFFGVILIVEVFELGCLLFFPNP
jgi:hypothetical protein